MPEFNSDTCVFDLHGQPEEKERLRVVEEQCNVEEKHRAMEARREFAALLEDEQRREFDEREAREEAEKQLCEEKACLARISAEDLRAVAAAKAKTIRNKDAELKALKADMAALQNKADSAEKKAGEEAGRAAKDLAAALDAPDSCPVRASVETLQPAPYTLHPAACTLHPTPPTVSCPPENLAAVVPS